MASGYELRAVSNSIPASCAVSTTPGPCSKRSSPSRSGTKTAKPSCSARSVEAGVTTTWWRALRAAGAGGGFLDWRQPPFSPRFRCARRPGRNHAARRRHRIRQEGSCAQFRPGARAARGGRPRRSLMSARARWVISSNADKRGAAIAVVEGPDERSRRSADKGPRARR